jgi:chitin synthase
MGSSLLVRMPLDVIEHLLTSEGQRTWGGPRADAGSADGTTTAQEAIEKADATGDDLNVVPETFKHAAEAHNNQLVRKAVPLQPPDRLEGKFAAAERLPGGWYKQANDSMVSTGGLPGLSSGRPHLHPRDSSDSNFSARTSNNSVYMPKRVESLMGLEDQRKYALAQLSQRAAGGAYMTDPPTGQVYELSEAELNRAGWKDSIESLGSHHNRPGYKPVGSYNGDEGDRTSPEAVSPVEATPSALVVPQASSSSQNRRSGRSPLACVSLIRTTSNDGNAIELEAQQHQPLSPAPRLSDHSPSHSPGARRPSSEPN